MRDNSWIDTNARVHPRRRSAKHVDSELPSHERHLEDEPLSLGSPRRRAPAQLSTRGHSAKRECCCVASVECLADDSLRVFGRQSFASVSRGQPGLRQRISAKQHQSFELG